MDERLAAAPVGIVEVTTEGVVTDLNDRAASLLDADSSASGEQPIDEVFPESVENAVPALFSGSDLEDQELEEYYPGPDRWLSVSVIPVGEAGMLYLEDATADVRDRQQIEELRGEIDRQAVTNDLISDILAELTDASAREEIAATICERLGETDLYEFAWVGEREVGGDEIAVHAAAGETGRTFERIQECLDDDGAIPERRAIETGTPEIVQSLGEDDSVPEPIRRGAFADGLQSLLAIPLTYGSTVYGVVGLYAPDRDAFSERERESFGTVGEIAGFAVNATRHRNLLLSDTVVELTIQVRDPAAPLVGAVTGAEGVMELRGTVPQGDALLCYLTVDGTDPADVASRLREQSAVTAVRTISEHDSGGAIEVTLSDETPLGRLSSQGATINRARFADGTGECSVELPPAEDVRRIAEAVTREYEASVTAKRQRERELSTRRDFREQLSDRLTEKQENALRTAFFADYFESPRSSSAEEVATALGITGPTLLHHLRAGQRKLLGSFFETTDRE